jgi:8-oxo-dGTP diphosphatase
VSATGTRPEPHPPATVTVDVAVLTVRAGRMHVLLLTEPDGGGDAAGRWRLPGGAKHPHQSLDTGAVRELAAVGVTSDAGHVEQLRSYGDPGRDPELHAVSVAYLSFVSDVVLADGPAHRAVRFWPLDDLLDGNGPALALDHARIIDDAVERARAKLEYTTLATSFVPDPFSVGDLYDVYRAVWGVEPGDRANFARKVKKTEGFVIETARTAPTEGRGRPAALFRAGPATRLHPPILRPAPVTS